MLIMLHIKKVRLTLDVLVPVVRKGYNVFLDMINVLQNFTVHSQDFFHAEDNDK